MKKLIYLIIVMVVLGIIVTGCNNPVVPPVEQTNTSNLTKGVTINVPADYITIQAAISAASPGATIFVAAGTYGENIIVDKSVSIKGAGAENTIVEGFNGNTAFTIYADNVSISGFTIMGANNVWKNGILVSEADNVSIINNIIEYNAYGVFLENSNGVKIINNIIRYSDAPRAVLGSRLNNGSGIIVWDNSGGVNLNNLIRGNDIYYNYKFGIYIGGAVDMDADGTKINGNKLYHNGAYWGLHRVDDWNWLGMGFENLLGTISVSGNNVFPTDSGLDYWVTNCPGLKLRGTPSYGGIPVPSAPTP